AEIERTQREPRAANEHVGGAKRHASIASASDPQKPAQIDSGPRRRPRVERLLGVDEGRGLALTHDVAEASQEIACATGGGPPDDLGDLPSERGHALGHNGKLIM